MKMHSRADGIFYETDSHQIFFGNKNSSVDKSKIDFENYTFLRLKQTHADKIILGSNQLHEADAQYTQSKYQALCISTADCAPIMIFDQASDTVAAVHAGWRGVANRITVKTLQQLQKLNCKPENLQVFIGPHIQMNSFEVDEPVKNQLLQSVQKLESTDFQVREENKFLVDLHSLLIKQILEQAIPKKNIHSIKTDTKANFDYHSFRRDQQDAGRQVSWIVSL